MDELDGLFTIDRCGSAEKSVKSNTKENTSSKKSKILYKCDSKLLEVKSDTTKPQSHKSAIPKQLNKRLHEAALEEKKINPGKLSDNLREALGLSKYGIPMHIYRMRYLGYPPGWLKQIEARPSELKFIGDDSRASNKNSIEYRIEDLIEYPGFNTLINYDPEEDHWSELGMIPMNKEQSIEEFSCYLKDKQNTLKFEADISGEHPVPIDQLEQHRQNILALIQDIELPASRPPPENEN